MRDLSVNTLPRNTYTAVMSSLYASTLGTRDATLPSTLQSMSVSATLPDAAIAPAKDEPRLALTTQDDIVTRDSAVTQSAPPSRAALRSTTHESRRRECESSVMQAPPPPLGPETRLSARRVSETALEPEPEREYREGESDQQ